MLENQCRMWPLTLAAAVYVPLLDGLVYFSGTTELHRITEKQAVTLLKELHHRMQRKENCNLRIKLFSEKCADQKAAVMYPVNSLRNKALQMVDTEAVLLMDVDFVVDRQFQQDVRTPEGWAVIERQLQHYPAIVLPAFEPNSTAERNGGAKWKLQHDTAVALDVLEAGKGQASKLFQSGKLTQFAVDTYWKGHGPTQYEEWLKADDFYGVEYHVGYEPYTIMRLQHVPWFDERFRGYGYNKMVAYLAMSGWGVTFTVHPRAFVVHMPHLEAKTKNMTHELGIYWTGHYQWFKEAKADLEQEHYYPTTSFAKYCALRP